MNTTKILLEEEQIPHRWYNISAHMADLGAELAPPKDPETGEPMGPEKLEPIFPESLIKQEVSREPFVDIPDEVRETYSLWRPTPLFRAHRWEEKLNTPARIYYKYEGVSPPGSHKPNTATAQTYYNKVEGTKRLATETGAGQWGSALSFATQVEGLECQVFMVRVSFDQKPYRKTMMQTWGAEVIPSPSDRTQAGRDILEEDPDSTGSLGIAIGEAIEQAATNDDTKYSLGSVLNHVTLHQTVIGEEVLLQLDKAGEGLPDVVIGCSGGGSNFAGICFPFIREAHETDQSSRFLAVEPSAAPSLTKGDFDYDFGDTAQMTPLMKMHTLGHDFIPAPIHSGGLRYHGMNPQVSALHDAGVIDAVNVPQIPVFEASTEFARSEGILPAPETGHAVWATRQEALKCRDTGEDKVLLFNLSGHGHFDLSAYEEYLSGDLENHEWEEVAE